MNERDESDLVARLVFKSYRDLIVSLRGLAGKEIEGIRERSQGDEPATEADKALTRLVEEMLDLVNDNIEQLEKSAYGHRKQP